jgi:hypothetical protein
VVPTVSKPYSEADFSAQVTEDRSWRIKEISDLKTAIMRADPALQRGLLRSLITICYAHWEGYVRFAARKFLEHVALRKFKYGELDRQFTNNYFLPRLASLSTSKASLAARCELVGEIVASGEKRFSRVNEDLVITRANLNFEVFADICLVCGVPSDGFSDKAVFVDTFLLKRRNGIAHGESTFVEIDDLDQLADDTIEIMRRFGDLLENRVYLKGYRAA